MVEDAVTTKYTAAVHTFGMVDTVVVWRFPYTHPPTPIPCTPQLVCGIVCTKIIHQNLNKQCVFHRLNYFAVQYSAVKCSTVQYSMIQCSVV